MSAPCRQIVAERDGIRCQSVDSFAARSPRSTRHDAGYLHHFRSVTGAAIALAAVIIRAQNATHRDIGDLRRDIGGIRREFADLRERMARLEGLFEGLFEGFTRREPAAPGKGTA